MDSPEEDPKPPPKPLIVGISKYKTYGLIVPSKNKKSKSGASPPPRKNIFDSDSEDDNDAPEWMKKKNTISKPQKSNSLQQKQAQEVIKKALKDDPTVYQYDEIYDDMEQKKIQSSTVKTEGKSKYIEQLLKASERRKLENEQRIERQVQKEREAEGDEFEDKEIFVTGAYRKKMEEQKQMLEDAKKRDLFDEMQDVTKQKDLGGFYRHLYKTTTSDPSQEEKGKEANEKQSPEVPSELSTELDKESDSPRGDTNNSGVDSRKIKNVRHSKSNSPAGIDPPRRGSQERRSTSKEAMSNRSNNLKRSRSRSKSEEIRKSRSRSVELGKVRRTSQSPEVQTSRELRRSRSGDRRRSRSRSKDRRRSRSRSREHRHHHRHRHHDRHKDKDRMRSHRKSHRRSRSRSYERKHKESRHHHRHRSRSVDRHKDRDYKREHKRRSNRSRERDDRREKRQDRKGEKRDDYTGSPSAGDKPLNSVSPSRGVLGVSKYPDSPVREKEGRRSPEWAKSASGKESKSPSKASPASDGDGKSTEWPASPPKTGGKSPRSVASPGGETEETKSPQWNESSSPSTVAVNSEEKAKDDAKAEEEELQRRVAFWAKRTVGELFDEARFRYLERKETCPVRPAVVSAN